MKTQKSRLEITYEYLMILIGVMIASLALHMFMIPNGIIDGGVTGISIMISTISTAKLGFLILIINIPFFILGFFQLGKRFILRASFAIAIFSVLLEVFEFLPHLTIDAIIASIFGGIILGIGVGLVIRYGGCLDGTETIAIMLSKKTELSVGVVVLFANIVIYTASAFIFGWDRALYSLLSYIICYKAIDLVVEGLEQGKAAFIVTDNGKILADSIYKNLGRTITYWDGNGLVSAEGKKIILVVLTRMEISELKRVVDEDEESSFMFIMDVADIFGNHMKKTKQAVLKKRKLAREGESV